MFDVLGRTAEVFLPALNQGQKDAVYHIQSELFYSILLVCSHNNNECLGMWKCLNPRIWTVEYAPEPNFVHYFVAAYSYLAGVLIFTVNYDTMFEMACSELGIKDYEVLLEPPEHGIKHFAHTLKICKLHGSADFDANGDINPAVFKTTMSEISKVNEPWLEYILSFFLDELQAKIPKIHIDAELFWIVFSQRMSSHKELHKCLLKFKRDISTLEKWEAYLFLSAKIRDECVHAQFVRYRRRKPACNFEIYKNNIKY